MSDVQAAKVLVCDDEPHIVQVVATKLRNAGFEVRTAEDGAAGLSQAREWRPAVIVSDFQMPRMSGIEMATQLRLQPETAEIPILLLTARGYTLTANDIAGTSIRTVAVKPFSPRQLLTAVQRLVADPSGTGLSLSQTSLGG